MGKRWVWWAVLFGLLVAGLQVWLVSAILSRPLPSGKTGWEVIAAEQAKRRSSNMPLVEGVSITYKCGNAVYGSSLSSGEGVTIRLRLNDYSPGLDYCVVEVYFSVGENTIRCGDLNSSGPFPQEVDCPLELYAFYPVPSGQYELQWISYGTGSSPSGSTGLILSVDNDTLPTFTTSTSYECNPDGIGVAEWTVSALVDNQPSSWSYELYSGSDATGSRVYAGSVNSAPSPPECSAWMKVTGIPGNAKSVKLIATNANGTAETVVNLVTAVINEVSFSADPPGILEGQDVTLTWTVAGVSGLATIPVQFVEIEPIVDGVFFNFAREHPWTASVTVSPTETTTYTITAYVGCTKATASVTVYVQAVPRPGMASLTWEAQAGVGSKKVARFDEPAVLNWTAVDPTRTPRTARVLCRASSLEDVRTQKTARVLARASVRGNMTTRVLCRATSLKPISVRVLARARSFYPDRHHVMARNVATGAVSEWGVVDHGEFPLTLSDVTISPGTYMVWVEREGVFWKNARLGSETKIVIADGQAPVTHSLPLASDLAASISLGLTTLTWTASTPITDFGVVWGLWFDDTASIDTSGNPDYSFMADIGQEEFEYTIMQSSSQYVAVAAIDPDANRGTSTELSLPWSTSAPTSPPNQVAVG